MAGPYRTTRRVEFSDTDMAGIVHFTAFFRYMESAEHELLRDLGLSVVSQDDVSQVSWPRVSARCEYSLPARFDDVLEIDVWVEALAERSVTFRFEFQRKGQRIAAGEMASVCCRVAPEGRIASIPIPVPIADKLRRRMKGTPRRVEP
jgi:4-hydroxybenzoyl-CoA thioesterase/acyl-CoA thioester hydrolase